MDFTYIKEALLDECYIDNIVCRGESQYAEIDYELVIRCDLITNVAIVPIIVGIPFEWETKLFDFYVRDYNSFPFIPHVERYGKMCLYDMEGVLIDDQFIGLLKQCFRRAAEVLSDGISGNNHKDFINEFNAYWLRLPNCGSVMFAVPKEKTCSRLYYSYNKRNRVNSEIDAYAELLGTRVLKDWGISGSLHRGCFIFVNPREYIYPPDPRCADLREYVNLLLKYVDAHDLRGLFKNDDKPFIIFEIRQPDGNSSFVSIFTKHGHVSENGGCFQFEKDAVLYPLNVRRIDKSYLMSRVDTDDNPLQELRTLIVGAGSIGGYLANFLAKTGCENITLVDNQIFAEENIYRHVLDKSCVGHYKVDALAKKIKAETPSISINTRADYIENTVQEGSVDFADYDVIFSVTGNHNINRWINKCVMQCDIKTPVIYAWNEPLDIGYHTAIVRADRTGTFDDLFARDDETNTLYDLTAFCARDQQLTRKMAGCGGSFIPYGSEISIQSATAAIDLLKRYYTGRNTTNEIVSYKGEGYYFRKAGLRTTSAYELQKECICRQRIVDLI